MKINDVELHANKIPVSQLEEVKELVEKAAKALENTGFRLIRAEFDYGFYAHFYFSRSPFETKDDPCERPITIRIDKVRAREIAKIGDKKDNKLEVKDE